MNVVWGDSPVAANVIVDRVAARKGWHRRTIRTLIDRLVRKGALGVDTAARPYHYSPKVSLRDCIRAESRSFLERVFGGEPAAMILHLVQETELSSADLKKLRLLLREKEK